jgi:hypothetical protein
LEDLSAILAAVALGDGTRHQSLIPPAAPAGRPKAAECYLMIPALTFDLTFMTISFKSYVG